MPIVQVHSVDGDFFWIVLNVARRYERYGLQRIGRTNMYALPRLSFLPGFLLDTVHLLHFTDHLLSAIMSDPRYLWLQDVSLPSFWPIQNMSQIYTGIDVSKYKLINNVMVKLKA